MVFKSKKHVMNYCLSFMSMRQSGEKRGWRSSCCEYVTTGEQRVSEDFSICHLSDQLTSHYDISPNTAAMSNYLDFNRFTIYFDKMPNIQTTLNCIDKNRDQSYHLLLKSKYYTVTIGRMTKFLSYYIEIMRQEVLVNAS